MNIPAKNCVAHALILSVILLRIVGPFGRNTGKHQLRIPICLTGKTVNNFELLRLCLYNVPLVSWYHARSIATQVWFPKCYNRKDIIAPTPAKKTSHSQPLQCSIFEYHWYNSSSKELNSGTHLVVLNWHQLRKSLVGQCCTFYQCAIWNQAKSAPSCYSYW